MYFTHGLTMLAQHTLWRDCRGGAGPTWLTPAASHSHSVNLDLMHVPCVLHA